MTGHKFLGFKGLRPASQAEDWPYNYKVGHTLCGYYVYPCWFCWLIFQNIPPPPPRYSAICQVLPRCVLLFFPSSLILYFYVHKNIQFFHHFRFNLSPNYLLFLFSPSPQTSSSETPLFLHEAAIFFILSRSFSIIKPFPFTISNEWNLGVAASKAKVRWRKIFD